MCKKYKKIKILLFVCLCWFVALFSKRIGLLFPSCQHRFCPSVCSSFPLKRHKEYKFVSSHCVLHNIIIHPCVRAVVICFSIWPCDVALCIAYLISHSSYACYYVVNERIFLLWVYNKYKTTPVCGYNHSWCPECTHSTDSCFQGHNWANLVRYGGLYQHT